MVAVTLLGHGTAFKQERLPQSLSLASGRERGARDEPVWKAPWDRRTPQASHHSRAREAALAFWSAVVLHRFSTRGTDE